VERGPGHLLAGRRRRLAIAGGIAVLAAFFAAGHALRQQLGIELTADSLRTWVAGHGWAAPAIFLAVLSFRPFLLLPSALLLSVGGLCFGTALGTALGATGLLASGVMQFGLARGASRDLVQARLGARARWLQRRLERAGPFAVGAVTAHPAGPLTWMAWAAGLSSVSLVGFVAAMAVGGIVRSFTYAIFGSALTDVTSPRFVWTTLLLLAVAIVPLLHPKVFRWMINT
jgi:uncharacterized membrane protein YdjX (TVP38/TMEM64 family)